MSKIKSDKLGPEELQQLQERIQYARKNVKDVLQDFRSSSQEVAERLAPNKPMLYEDFEAFLITFLECDLSTSQLPKQMYLALQRTHKPPLSLSRKNSITPAPSNRQSQLLSSPSTPNMANYNHRRDDQNAINASVTSTGSEIQSATSGANSGTLNNYEQYSNNKDLTKRNSHNQNARDTPVSTKNNSSVKSVTISAKGDRKQLEDEAILPSVAEVMCYLSLLKAGSPSDKLEFMFRLYDCDNSDYLETHELDNIVQQMLLVGRYLGWDVSELEPILEDMLQELDCNNDKKISLDEWIKGGSNNIPLLVLLGIDTQVRENCQHQWRWKKFRKPAFCNFCLGMLLGLGKQGLTCSFCKFTVHERCVQKAPTSCVNTYVKSSRAVHQKLEHHWVVGNCPGKCDRCQKSIKSYKRLTGVRCAWCHLTLHDKCLSGITVECDLGKHKNLILPPTAICPKVLERHRSVGDSPPPTNSSHMDGLDMQIAPLENSVPLIVYVNPKSGGQQGRRTLQKFQYLLNPRQVYNLLDGGPTPGLKFIRNVPNFRVLCCGGDGTAGWVLATIDKMEIDPPPPIAILPLGTGNDLARWLDWGGGYDGGNLSKILQQIEQAVPVSLDRWNIDISAFEGLEGRGEPVPLNVFNNYYSIGVDASIAHKFHTMRQKNPEKFSSRIKNKWFYFGCGAEERLSSSCKSLNSHIDVICDGKAIDLTDTSLEGIVILNIPSMYGGTNIWGNTSEKKKSKKKEAQKSSHRFVPQVPNDRLLEVVGLENASHVGQLITGLREHGVRLAQASNIVIRTKKEYPMQIDGEPWIQPPSTIRITFRNQMPMLQNFHRSRKVKLLPFVKRRSRSYKYPGT